MVDVVLRSRRAKKVKEGVARGGEKRLNTESPFAFVSGPNSSGVITVLMRFSISVIVRLDRK